MVLDKPSRFIGECEVLGVNNGRAVRGLWIVAPTLIYAFTSLYTKGMVEQFFVIALSVIVLYAWAVLDDADQE